jgi:DNA primase
VGKGPFGVDKTDLITRVVERYGARIRHRQGWQALRCIRPSHDDRNPSASVNLATGQYLCHSCGLSGDGFDLMLELEGLKAKDATEALRLDRAVDSEWLW